MAENVERVGQSVDGTAVGVVYITEERDGWHVAVQMLSARAPVQTISRYHHRPEAVRVGAREAMARGCGMLVTPDVGHAEWIDAEDVAEFAGRE